MAKRDFGTASFANEMKKTMEKAEAKGNSVTAINIRLDLIDENPDNNTIFNMDDIERLAKTIEQDGFSGAIEVILKDDGRYEISAGHRRCRAVKLLGWETIPAIVSISDNTIKKRKKLIKSNINNRNMKPMDWARTIAYHKDTLCMEDAETQGKKFVPGQPYTCSRNMPLWDRMEEDFGLKKSAMLKYLRLLKLIPELQEMIDAGQIPPMAASNLGNEPEDVQHACYEMMKEQLSLFISSDDEEPEPSLLASSVFNIIKSVKTKFGIQEIKEKRNEEYLSYMSSNTGKIDMPEPVNFEQRVDSDSPVFEPLPFPAVLPDISADDSPVTQNVDNILPKINTDIINTSTSVVADATHNESIPYQTVDETDYIDNTIIRVSNELALIAHKACVIRDKDSISEKLNQIEEDIQIIRNKFNG